MDKDNLYLQHILDAINIIEEAVKNVTYEDFCNDSFIQGGYIRQLEIIGEASSRLSEGFKRDNDNIPWRKIIGARNKLIHDYFGVNLKIVWEAVTKDIPELKKALEK